MAENTNYHDELNKKSILKLRELLAGLPALLQTVFQRDRGHYRFQDPDSLCV